MKTFKRVLYVTALGVGGLVMVTNPVSGIITLGVGFVGVSLYDAYQRLPKR